MKTKKLLILHTKKKVRLDEENIFFVNLGEGIVESKNCYQISLKKFYKKYFELYKKKFVKALEKKTLTTNKKNLPILELEIFNIRNDKIKEINSIINVLILKKLVKKKGFKQISLITDNYVIQKIFNKNFPNLENQSKKIPTKKHHIFLKVTKFYLKTIFFLIFIKFFKKKLLLKENYTNACISLAPIFYKNKEENFFKEKKSLMLNFILTDETHLNFSFLQALSTYNKKYENLIHVESFIKIRNVFFELIKSYKYLYFAKQSNMRLNIENFDFSTFYEDYFLKSLINRLKLNIYDRALFNLFKKFRFKRFKMYLFEYCFGFYLINLIKKNFKKVEIIGHQHGIFSDKLLWFEVIKNSRIKNNYLPHKIVSFNPQSFHDYKKVLKNKNLKFSLTKKKLSELSILAKVSQKKKTYNRFLVLPGTHDAKTIYDNLKKKAFDSKTKKTVFFFKFHPKNKIDVSSSKNIKSISSVKNIKFDAALISSTSTLVYDFIKLKKNFMVYDIDNKQNLISSNLQKKIKFYKI